MKYLKKFRQYNIYPAVFTTTCTGLASLMSASGVSLIIASLISVIIWIMALRQK